MSWLIHLIIIGHGNWGLVSTLQAFGVPFTGQLSLVLSSDSEPYRVTEGSLWDKRWLLQPIDLFNLSFPAMNILYFPQTDLFILLSLKRANKESITRDTHKQKLVFIFAGYLLENKKILNHRHTRWSVSPKGCPPWMCECTPALKWETSSSPTGGKEPRLRTERAAVLCFWEPQEPLHTWISRKSLERPLFPWEFGDTKSQKVEQG